MELTWTRDCNMCNSHYRRSLFLVLLSLSLHAGEVGGTVLDPAHLPVPRATVTLVCQTGQQSAVADTRGRFQFPWIVSAGPCELSVSHPQFATYRKAVSAASGPLTVSL